MPFIDIEGHALHYQIHGSGFPVLLGHSYLWDSSMWQPQIEMLSRSFQVVAVDLWGHGQSSALPDGTRTLGDLARHALHLLDALGIEQCAVVGLSVGGMWGAELALLAPQRVRTLVMMDTHLGAEPEATLSRYTQLLDAIESAGQFPAPILDAVVPLFFRPGVDLDLPVPAALRQSLQEFSAQRLRESIVPLGRLIFGRPDAMDRLAKLDASRTLLMCGAQDIPRKPAETIAMADIIGCKYELVPDAGHISNLENPAFVNEVLQRWLAQQADTPKH